MRETFKAHSSTFKFILIDICTGFFFSSHWAINLAEIINARRNRNMAVVNATLPLIYMFLNMLSWIFTVADYENRLADPLALPLGGSVFGLLFGLGWVINIIFVFSAANALKNLDNRLHFSGIWLILFTHWHVYYRLHNFGAQFGVFDQNEKSAI